MAAAKPGVGIAASGQSPRRRRSGAPPPAVAGLIPRACAAPQPLACAHLHPFPRRWTPSIMSFAAIDQNGRPVVEALLPSNCSSPLLNLDQQTL